MTDHIFPAFATGFASRQVRPGISLTFFFRYWNYCPVGFILDYAIKFIGMSCDRTIFHLHYQLMCPGVFIGSKIAKITNSFHLKYFNYQILYF